MDNSYSYEPTHTGYGDPAIAQAMASDSFCDAVNAWWDNTVLQQEYTHPNPGHDLVGEQQVDPQSTFDHG